MGNRTKLKVNGATYATYTYDAVNRLTNLKDGANLNFAYLDFLNERAGGRLRWEGDDRGGFGFPRS